LPRTPFCPKKAGIEQPSGALLKISWVSREREDVPLNLPGGGPRVDEETSGTNTSRSPGLALEGGEELGRRAEEPESDKLYSPTGYKGGLRH